MPSPTPPIPDGIFSSKIWQTSEVNILGDDLKFLTLGRASDQFTVRTNCYFERVQKHLKNVIFRYPYLIEIKWRNRKIIFRYISTLERIPYLPSLNISTIRQFRTVLIRCWVCVGVGVISTAAVRDARYLYSTLNIDTQKLECEEEEIYRLGDFWKYLFELLQKERLEGWLHWRIMMLFAA